MSSHRYWGSLEDGQIEFVSLSTETLEGALDVIRKSFVSGESACTGVDILFEPGASEEILELCIDSAKDGVTVIAIDTSTSKVVGVLFNKIQVRTAGKSYFEQFSDNCKCKSSKALVDFMINVDSRIDLFNKYNVNCILEIMFLAVLPEYKQRRIGESLVLTTLQIGTELKKGNNMKVPVMIHGKAEVMNADMVPSLVTALMTSKFTQRIAIKFGFEELLKISFEEFEFNGRKFSDRITSIHKDCILVAKILELV